MDKEEAKKIYEEQRVKYGVNGKFIYFGEISLFERLKYMIERHSDFCIGKVDELYLQELCDHVKSLHDYVEMQNQNLARYKKIFKTRDDMLKFGFKMVEDENIPGLYNLYRIKNQKLGWKEIKPQKNYKRKKGVFKSPEEYEEWKKTNKEYYWAYTVSSRAFDEILGTNQKPGPRFGDPIKVSPEKHLLVYFWVHNRWPEIWETIDHANGDNTDNRISNLDCVNTEINGDRQVLQKKLEKEYFLPSGEIDRDRIAEEVRRVYPAKGEIINKPVILEDMRLLAHAKI